MDEDTRQEHSVDEYVTEEELCKALDFMNGCRIIRIILTIFMAGFILYGLIGVPLWVFASVGFDKFDLSIDGWVLGTGIVTLWILVNSLFREIPRGSYRERRKKWLNSQKDLHMAARMSQ